MAEPAASPGDDQLIAAVAQGDHPALLALYDRHGRVAYGLAYRILNDAGAAEEAVQDAFVRIWRRAASFDPMRGVGRAWLLTIVHHCAIDLVRRRAGRRQWWPAWTKSRSGRRSPTPGVISRASWKASGCAARWRRCQTSNGEP